MSTLKMMFLGMSLGVGGLFISAIACQGAHSDEVGIAASEEEARDQQLEERQARIEKADSAQPFRDPVTRAIVARRNVAFWEQQLNKRLASVREQLAELEPDDFSTIDATAKELKNCLLI